LRIRTVRLYENQHGDLAHRHRFVRIPGAPYAFDPKHPLYWPGAEVEHVETLDVVAAGEKYGIDRLRGDDVLSNDLMYMRAPDNAAGDAQIAIMRFTGRTSRDICSPGTTEWPTGYPTLPETWIEYQRAVKGDR